MSNKVSACLWFAEMDIVNIYSDYLVAFLQDKITK